MHPETHESWGAELGRTLHSDPRFGFGEEQNHVASILAQLEGQVMCSGQSCCELTEPEAAAGNNERNGR